MTNIYIRRCEKMEYEHLNDDFVLSYAKKQKTITGLKEE
jgi:hypothetical protein